MILRPFTQAASVVPPLPPNIASALSNVRGGAVAGAALQAGAAFDMGLAKTRLEGLAYGTVTALIIGSSLALFKCVPDRKKALLPLPSKDDIKARKLALFENTIRMAYGMLTSIAVALGCYTTIVFTMMGIYSKTALGMGLVENYVNFFNSCAKFRVFGFYAFMGTLMTFSVGWVLALILCHEGEMKWYVAIPPSIITLLATLHFKEIFNLAGTLIFST